MTSEWVVVAAAAIGLLGGLAVAWLTARLTSERERETRSHQAKAEAYLELLTFMNLKYRAASSRVPFPAESSEAESDPLPDPDPAASARVSALLSAYGSPTIADNLYPAWFKSVAELERLADESSAKQRADPSQVFAVRQRCLTATAAVAAQVRREL